MQKNLVHYILIQNFNSLISVITTSVILLLITQESLYFYANAITLMPVIFFADQGVSRLILMNGHRKYLQFHISTVNYKIFIYSILFFIFLNFYLSGLSNESISIIIAIIFNYITSLIYSVLHFKKNKFFNLVLLKIISIIIYTLIFLNFIELKISIILTIIVLFTLYYQFKQSTNQLISVNIKPLNFKNNIFFILIGLIPYLYLFMFKNTFPLLAVCLSMGIILSSLISPILINKGIKLVLGSFIYSLISILIFFLYITIINYFKLKINYFEFQIDPVALLHYFIGFILINLSFYLQTLQKNYNDKW
jgi:hypothetical protein